MATGDAQGRARKASRASCRRSKPAQAKTALAGASGPRPTLAGQILDILEKTHPEARCALDYRNPFELSVATILSAQCTDERVNKVTPVLFDALPHRRGPGRGRPAEVEDDHPLHRLLPRARPAASSASPRAS